MEISSLFDRMAALPTIPKVAQDLIQQFDNPNSSIDSVARNISLDPVIAAKVLRLANSSRFRGSRPSNSVEDAAMRLGFNTLRTLVLASAVTGAFKNDSDFDMKAFWLQSFQVASLCRLLAKFNGVAIETAFTCGMMHNIGELLIQTGLPELASQFNRSGKTGSTDVIAQQTLQLGFGFPEVGAELARRWQLPPLIQEAIAFQARPLQAPKDHLLPGMIARSVLITEALREHDGINPESRAALNSPLFEGMDMDALFAALPEILEADKAFAELLN